MAKRIYPNARDRILDAAERVLVRDGVGSLSVDAVIGEAGLSKGGFFHHFESKDALLGAIAEKLARQCGEEVAAAAGRDPEPRGRRLRAQINLAFNPAPRNRARMQALVLGLIEAASSSKALVAKVRAANEEMLAADDAEKVPLGAALIVQFALDGYWLAESLGTFSLPPAARNALRDALYALTRKEAS